MMKSTLQNHTNLRMYHEWRLEQAQLAVSRIAFNTTDLPFDQEPPQEEHLAQTQQSHLEKAPTATIPRATYRLQLNPQWTFEDAQQTIPYFQQLGISHCYASPLLQARPGSSHGYDIVNHRQLNCDMGGETAFEHFSEALKGANLKLMVDVVPNHMGIGSHNPWWMDVLENGEASPYSQYFDIDWEPIKPELHGKVLIPVLGDHYGNVLTHAQLSLQFSAEAGLLSLHYYEHHFPINPQSYPLVLEHRLHQLEQLLGATHPEYQEYLSIITAFKQLPNHHKTSVEARQQRIREKTIASQRLTRLCSTNATITAFITENLMEFGQHPDNKTPDGNSTERLHQLLERQPYRLAYWRVAMDEINYRRFFDVNDLAGIRMEASSVFEDTHALIFKLVATDQIHALRIDHPDGLYDPAAYFQRLQHEALKALSQNNERLPSDIASQVTTPAIDPTPLYVVAEKILAAHEQIPEDWPVHGTTGYEFLNHLTELWVDSNNEKSLNQMYSKFTGRPATEDAFQDLVYRCKVLIMQTALASELNVLVHQLNRISEKRWSTRDYTLNQLRNALIQIIACFPVYRTYITEKNGIHRKDRTHIDWAVSLAQKRRPNMDTSIFDFIRQVLLLDLPTDGVTLKQSDLLGFVMRFQQYTGPVMAKSLEDTAFYRFNRLTAFNEVGGEPSRFGLSTTAFHYQNQNRQEHRPHTLLATSTHDAKRSEDVRAKLAVLSEVPRQWQPLLSRWRRFNRLKKTPMALKLMPSTSQVLPQDLAPSKNDEYLLYQTIIGVWPYEPMTPEDHQTFINRIQDYMIKAVREAKEFSSWLNPNDEYENALRLFIQSILNPSSSNLFLREIGEFSQNLAPASMINSLSQVVLKLTCPGVPDIYQGTELWDLSLVDPDNRRPVDFSWRQTMLNEIITTNTLPTTERLQTLSQWQDTPISGQIKLFVVHTLLQFRARYPVVFDNGYYQPLLAEGDLADHVVAFTRSLSDEPSLPMPRLLIIVPRLVYWLLQPNDPDLRFPPSTWDTTYLSLESLQDETIDTVTLTNLFTHETITCHHNEKVCLSQLLGSFPVGVFCY